VIKKKQIFCNSCCNFFIPVPFNQFREKVRVCRSCNHALVKAERADTSTGSVNYSANASNDSLAHSLSSKTVNSQGTSANTPPAPSTTSTITPPIALPAAHPQLTQSFSLNGLLKNLTETFYSSNNKSSTSSAGFSSKSTSTPAAHKSKLHQTKSSSSVTSVITLSGVTPVTGNADAGNVSSRTSSSTGSSSNTNSYTAGLVPVTAAEQQQPDVDLLLQLNDEFKSSSSLAVENDFFVQVTTDNIIADSHDGEEVDEDDMDTDDDDDSFDENHVANSFLTNKSNLTGIDLDSIRSPQSFDSVLSLDTNLDTSNATSASSSSISHNNTPTHHPHVYTSVSSNKPLVARKPPGIQLREKFSRQVLKSLEHNNFASDELVMAVQEKSRNASVSSLSSLNARNGLPSHYNSKFAVHSREVVLADYAYLSKVSSSDSRQGADEDTAVTTIVLKSAEAEDSVRNSCHLKKIWDRMFLVLYSDLSIGSCLNPNVSAFLYK
jgi:hypothetical protein